MEGYKFVEIRPIKPKSSVYRLTLNRPSRRNALSEHFFDEFPKALQSLDLNPDVSVIILTGAGDHFCSGIDPHNTQKAKMKLHYADLTDASSLRRWIDIIEPDEVYNLAAQSHVAVSFEIPDYTADVVATGALRLLEAVRSHIAEEAKIKADANVNGNPRTQFIPK